MNIETKWLKDFLALAETQNFSLAAQSRYVTQPAFSRRIKALEQKLSCKLFNRLNHPIVLTEQGQRFEKTAKEMLAALAKFNDYRDDNNATTLTVAATHTLSLGVFPAFLEKMRQLPFDIETKLKVADADDCVNLLTSKRCDYLLAFSDPLLKQLHQDSLLLGKVKLLPVCKTDDFGQPCYRLSDVENVTPYLGYQHSIYLGRVVNRLISRNQSRLNVQQILESSMADSLKMMALKGLGVAWIPEFSIHDELANNKLAIAGGHQWQPELEVRLYRNNVGNEPLQKLWQSLQSFRL